MNPSARRLFFYMDKRKKDELQAVLKEIKSARKELEELKQGFNKEK